MAPTPPPLLPPRPPRMAFDLPPDDRTRLFAQVAVLTNEVERMIERLSRVELTAAPAADVPEIRQDIATLVRHIAELRATIAAMKDRDDHDLPFVVRWINRLSGDWFTRLGAPGAAHALSLLKSVVRWAVFIALVWFALDTALWYRDKEDTKIRAMAEDAESQRRAADALREIADEEAAPLSPHRDTVATVPASGLDPE